MNDAMSGVGGGYSSSYSSGYASGGTCTISDSFPSCNAVSFLQYDESGELLDIAADYHQDVTGDVRDLTLDEEISTQQRLKEGRENVGR